jgi:outer membrane receptor protein involved in Fe transport
MFRRFGFLVILCGLLGLSAAVSAQQPTQQPPPQPAQKPKQPPIVHEQVEVVATRVPEAPHDVPAALEVIDGDTLRAMGATNLREALSLAAGVEIAPGGDGGPAGSVPEFWGLREFDAFLLVVDNIPWGGAFNPALTSLNLHDVERVEILRGPAPVTFGVTSFVGVIHVVHKSAAVRDRYATFHGGSFGSGGGSIDLGLPSRGGWNARLTVDGEKQGFADSRTQYARGHAMFRAARETSARKMWFMADVNMVNQDPASPFPREGTVLSTAVALDSNFNPAGAFINDQRISMAFGMSRPMHGTGSWVLTGSFSHASSDIFRGFLTDISGTPNNSSGLREKLDLNDIYVDTHVIRPVRAHVQWVFGADFLHGMGDAKGATFKYTVPLAGPAPVVTAPTTLDLGSEDRREFIGGYTMLEWKPKAKLSISGGVRLNVTMEERGENETAAQKAAGKDPLQTNVRPSGSVGALATLWERGTNHVKVYATYRDTFKPAAVDFGIGESEVEGVLKPETSQSVDAGLKARFLDGRVDFEIDSFHMNFTNLVTSTTVNGLPKLVNSGKERFKGVEVAADVRLPRHVAGRASYSLHSARFVDVVKEFDPGVPTQLAGKRLEMSARHLFSGGILVAPNTGVVASLIVKYTGSRFLNQRNTAISPAFSTIDLGIGYRVNKIELRFDGRNLGNKRDPVSESELGDAQYYRMGARQFVFGLNVRF